MSDDGTSFTIDLPVTGQSGVDAAASSVDVLAAQLDSASRASLAAAYSLKVGEASYAEAAATANQAAKAIEKLGISADAQRGKLKAAMDIGDVAAADAAAARLRNLTNRQSEAATKSAAAKTALDAEASALDRLKAAAISAELAEKKMKEAAGGTAAKPKNKEEAGDFNVEKLNRGLGRIGGPLAEIGRKFGELKSGWDKVTESLGEDGPIIAATVGVAALAAAVVAASVAAVKAVVSFAAWAIGLADARQSALLLSQGIARTVEGGTRLNEDLNNITKLLPLSREELSGMAQNLANAGLRGAALTTALNRTAIAAAKLKFGPDFEKQMLSLDQQSKVFQANISGLFGGLHADGILTALQKVVGLFDETSASGRAIKVVFESVFQPLIDKVAEAEPKIERLFLQIEIWALKSLISVKPFGSTFVFIGEAALKVAEIFGSGLADGVDVAMNGVLSLMGALRAGVGIAESFGNALLIIKEKISSFSLVDMGRAMIDGLVKGIESGAASLVSSVTGAVDGAITSAKKALGIASPSKVFAEIGMQTGAGMAVGVDHSSERVRTSLESMVSPPSVHSEPSEPSAAPAPATHAGVNMSGAVFNFHGVEGAEDAESRFSALLTRVLEGDVAQLGAAVPQT